MQYYSETELGLLPIIILAGGPEVKIVTPASSHQNITPIIVIILHSFYTYCFIVHDIFIHVHYIHGFTILTITSIPIKKTSIYFPSIDTKD